MEKLKIREVSLEDASRLIEIYNYYIEETAITYEIEDVTVEDFRGRISNTLKKYPYLVAEYEGKIIGYVYASSFVDRAAYDHCATLSIYLDKDYHGLGAGRALYEAIEERLLKMGVVNLYACIAYTKVEDEYLTNNSMRFHEHMGYKLCGTFNECGRKFGRCYDMIYMEKLIR
ncbi:GNAT family N-acetyltransferase [Butyrivibrio sp. AE3006]|uniref:GNAT family N-acetyltransferase n=1 Tax=Butyrivibrio sp. AE3006 TaxID=1280673 RepID=UPI000415E8ED|nr:GNAT family N-acetyltransferase [Butyrivibrio sp. AE3006]